MGQKERWVRVRMKQNCFHKCFLLRKQWFYVEGFFFCHIWSYSLLQKDAFCLSIKWRMRNIQRKHKKIKSLRIQVQMYEVEGEEEKKNSKDRALVD